MFRTTARILLVSVLFLGLASLVPVTSDQLSAQNAAVPFRPTFTMRTSPSVFPFPPNPNNPFAQQQQGVQGVSRAEFKECKAASRAASAFKVAEVSKAASKGSKVALVFKAE